MGNRHITKRTVKVGKDLHPHSRKAAQLNRVNERVVKLKKQTKLLKGSTALNLQRPLFFLWALSSSHPLSVPSIKALITEVYLARFDARMAELQAERRSGRPKLKEQVDLEEKKKEETAEYDTGLEIPDLTHPPTVRYLFSFQDEEKTFGQSHLANLQLVRVSRGSDELVLSRKGKLQGENKVQDGDEDMERHEGEDWTELAAKSNS